eukprot:GAHX01001181.1.p1 GENE.GAHX01001181.1~~GAHX01001181.1.p1  ORF type:complete len:340 (+),score=87.95 GAHX01001181.1:51-1022(+)
MNFLLSRLHEYEDLEQHTSSKHTDILRQLYSIIQITDPSNINNFTKNLIQTTAEAVVFGQPDFELKLKQLTDSSSIYAFLNPNNPLHLFYFRVKKCYSRLSSFVEANKDQLASLFSSKHRLFEAINLLSLIEHKKTNQNTKEITASSFNQTDSFKVVSYISINNKKLSSLNCYMENMEEIKTLLKLQVEIKANTALESTKLSKCKINNKEDSLLNDTSKDILPSVSYESLYTNRSKEEGLPLKKIKLNKTVFLFKNKDVGLDIRKEKIKILDLKKKIGNKIGLKFNKIKLEVNDKIMKDIEVIDLSLNMEIKIKQKVRGGKNN